MDDILKKNATGQGPISEGVAVDAGKLYQLISVSLKLDIAPTTSENITITRLSAAGAVYDVPLYIVDLSVLSATSFVWQPDQAFYLDGGDELEVAWDNTDDRQWGLEIALLRIGL